MKKIFATVLVALLAACTTKTASVNPPMDFSKEPVIRLNVADIQVQDNYQPTFTAPNIEHLMDSTPSDGIKTWARQRLQAVGSSKLLQVNIIDASVKETDLPKKKGFSGFITDQQDKKIDARIEVELKIYGEDPLSEADATVVVTRSVTIPESYTVNQRKSAYDKLVSDTMAMFNNRLEKQMQKYMGNYISY